LNKVTLPRHFPPCILPEAVELSYARSQLLNLLVSLSKLIMELVDFLSAACLKLLQSKQIRGLSVLLSYTNVRKPQPRARTEQGGFEKLHNHVMLSKAVAKNTLSLLNPNPFTGRLPDFLRTGHVARATHVWPTPVGGAQWCVVE